MGFFDQLRRWIGLSGADEAPSGPAPTPDAQSAPTPDAPIETSGPRPAPHQPPPPGAPDEPPSAVALEQAQRAFAAGDFAQASDVAAEGLAALPSDEDPGAAIDALASSLLAVRGGAAVNLGQLDEAITHFEQSMERARASGLSDTLSAARLNLVDVRTRSGSFVEPDPVLDEAVGSAPGTRFEDPAGKLLVERGAALAARNELPAAAKAFDRVLAFRPDWPFPLYQRGWVRFLQGDSGGALDDYREVARRHPIFFTVQREIRGLEDVAGGKIPIEAYRSYCVVRGEIAKNAQAVVDAAHRIVEKYPDFAPAWVLLAEARLATGLVDEAREASREALRKEPDADTAVAALFAEWHLATRAGETDVASAAADRLRNEFADYPATEVVRRLSSDPTPDPRRMVQWTWAMDGTLHIREFTREDAPPAAN